MDSGAIYHCKNSPTNMKSDLVTSSLRWLQYFSENCITAARIHHSWFQHDLFPSIICNWQIEYHSVIQPILFCSPGIPTTIKTMGVNITTIVYLRVLIIQIGSTIILMVVEAQGFFIQHFWNTILSGIFNLKHSMQGVAIATFAPKQLPKCCFF